MVASAQSVAVESGAAPDTPLSRLFRGIALRPAAVLAAVAALTLLAVSLLVDFRTGELRLQVDPTLDPLVAPDDPERQFYEATRRRFGNDEGVVVVVEAPDLYAADALARLDRVSRALYELDGVAAVSSLTTTAFARRSEDHIVFERLLSEQFADADAVAWLKQAVAENPLAQGHLVSADGRAAAIAVSLENYSDRELRTHRVLERIASIARAESAPDVRISVTGAPLIRAATSDAVLRQLRWVVPAIVALLTVLLAVSFRSRAGVLLPLAVIAIALIWTLATLSVLGRPLNLVTSLVPPLLATMGLAYCGHLLAEFHSQPERTGAHERYTAVVALLHEVGPPILLTGVTTCAGLLALALNDLPAIREFAWLSALGVLYLVLLTLTFVPAALRLRFFSAHGRDLPARRLFEQGSKKLGEFDTRRRRRILVVAGVVFVLAAAASARIRVGDSAIGIFPPDSPVRSDFEAAGRALGGVTPLSLVIDAPPGTFAEPLALRRLRGLQTWLTLQPEVGAATGLADHVAVLGAYLADGAQDKLRDGIPVSRVLTQQLLFFGDGGALRSVVNADRGATQINLRLRDDDSAAVSALLARLQPRLAELPPDWQVRVTGSAMLVATSTEKVVGGQLESIALALLLVYACLALQFMSLRIGLLAAMPTALQTALYFGALGVSGVALNATTSLVECLVLGLAVDDTIHYLARFNGAAKRLGSESRAAVSALSAVLRPVTLTKAILALGFLMLVTGELENQRAFGWLAAFTLFAAWLVDIFVTPAFMSGVRVVNIWDTLRLDLGRKVQSTIPLFAGLSNRQARIFALMARMQTVPAGTRLITEDDPCGDGRTGDPSGDVYVVIEGELAVWVERDGKRIDLNTIRRGGVVGETGYFGQRRTANVDTMARTRLLRFDDADQERICRQYPRIAARVFLNLARIQAERRAQQMQQIRA